MKAGAIVIWTEIGPGGTQTERIGEVWSQAPTEIGVDPYWVIDSETERPVAIAKSGKRPATLTGESRRFYPTDYRVTIPTGDYYTETAEWTPTGAATTRANPETAYAQAA
jgi:hypothetical protein